MEVNHTRRKHDQKQLEKPLHTGEARLMLQGNVMWLFFSWYHRDGLCGRKGTETLRTNQQAPRTFQARQGSRFQDGLAGVESEAGQRTWRCEDVWGGPSEGRPQSVVEAKRGSLNGLIPVIFTESISSTVIVFPPNNLRIISAVVKFKLWLSVPSTCCSKSLVRRISCPLWTTK